MQTGGGKEEAWMGRRMDEKIGGGCKGEHEYGGVGEWTSE